MNKNIDINCDMGESYYNRKIGNDEQIMEYISSCNIACGFHGGDPYTISKTIDYALINNVKIGAHPSCIGDFGVQDLSGNVGEWTQSNFEPSLNGEEKVVKGGSARQPSWAGRCAYRAAVEADHSSEEIGFRCCMDAKGS